MVWKFLSVAMIEEGTMAEAAIQPAGTKPEVLALARRKITIGRETGFWAILVFTFSSIGLAYSGLLPFSTLAGMWPGANLAGMIAIGAAFFLVFAYTFAAIGRLVPLFGADYVIASRVISPTLAFISSWMLVLCLALWGGGIVAWMGQSIVPMFIRILSLVVVDKSLLNIADWAASPYGMIMLGTIGVILIFLMLVFPPRVTHWVLLAGAVLSVVAWVLVGYLLASSTPGAFQSGWDRFMGEGSFLEHVFKARSLGLKLDFTPGATVMAGLLVSLWLFSGCCTPTYFAREIKDPKKTLLMGSWTGLVMGAGILVSVTVLVQRLVPLEWLAAESSLSHSTAFQGLSMPWLPFYAVILRPNAILVYLLGLAWIFALINLAYTLLYSASRIILAWGEDHLIPDSAMFIHPELRSPLILVLLVCLLAEAALVWAALSPAYFYRVNPVFYIAAAQLLPVLGVTLMPFLKREWFEQAGEIARSRVGSLPLVAITGAISLLYLVGMFIWLGLGKNLLGWETLLGFAIVVVTGLAWFYARRYYLIRQGKDLDRIFKSIPVD
jgi:amino acid transporter